jgi:hypothetical protein
MRGPIVATNTALQSIAMRHLWAFNGVILFPLCVRTIPGLSLGIAGFSATSTIDELYDALLNRTMRWFTNLNSLSPSRDKFHRRNVPAQRSSPARVYNDMPVRLTRIEGIYSRRGCRTHGHYSGDFA